MFSETFLVALIVAGLFAGCAVLFFILLARSGRLALGWAAAMCFAVFVVILAIVEGSVRVFADPFVLSVLAVPLAAVVLALAWAWGLRRWSDGRAKKAGGKAVASGLLVLPALLGAGYFYQQQALPDSVCAQSHIPVDVGAVSLVLPLVFHANLTLEGHQQRFRYTPKPRYKEARKDLCALTRNGTQAVRAKRVSLAEITYLNDLTQACERETASFCVGFKAQNHASLGAFRIMTADQDGISYELRQMAKAQGPHLEHGGTIEAGYVCELQTGGAPLRHCRMWRQLKDGVVALAISNKTEEGTFADILELLEQEFDYTLQALTQQGG